MIEVDSILLFIVILFAIIGFFGILLIIIYFYPFVMDHKYNILLGEFNDYKKANKEMRQELSLLYKENNHLKALHNYKIVKEEEMK